RRTRYSRYAGGPDPLAPPVDLTDALNDIAEDIMAGYSPEQALREYLRRGARGQDGFDELAWQAAQRRREILERSNLGGTLQEVKALLDDALLQERAQLARDIDMDDTDRAFRELQLENLPESTPAAVSELNNYDWQSTDAREKFEHIRDLLGREMLDQQFSGMKQVLKGATEEDKQAIAEMIRDLNELLSKHREAPIPQLISQTLWPSTGSTFRKTRAILMSSLISWRSVLPLHNACSIPCLKNSAMS